MTGNDFLSSLHLIVFETESVTVRATLSPGCGCSMIWLKHILAQEMERERFQNIMINNSFHKWNYSPMCSFLVNWILEENHSHNCYISGSREIMIGFWVIIIFIVFISPSYNRLIRSFLLLAAATLLQMIDSLKMWILMEQIVSLAVKWNPHRWCNISFGRAAKTTGSILHAAEMIATAISRSPCLSHQWKTISITVD